MQAIRQTIEEYRESREIIKKRIRELSAEILKCSAENRREDSSVKQLHERRMKLYTELWDIEYAIREMQEYCDLTSSDSQPTTVNHPHLIQDVTENAS